MNSLQRVQTIPVCGYTLTPCQLRQALKNTHAPVINNAGLILQAWRNDRQKPS